ncbi:hypothetical protein AOQ84DRAFT_370075 [Glonium stellatum]|uniref:Uncharacterized protein n=1 Tax=Glonium stellatum TaxID=574774 RepID=A0A8E2JLG5_9PEZI|nr:hypothetical protein AOQ84DRAFT_370075 [Glonium stellatum]
MARSGRVLRAVAWRLTPVQLSHVEHVIFAADYQSINTSNSPPLAERAADPLRPHPCFRGVGGRKAKWGDHRRHPNSSDQGSQETSPASCIGKGGNTPRQIGQDEVQRTALVPVGRAESASAAEEVITRHAISPRGVRAATHRVTRTTTRTAHSDQRVRMMGGTTRMNGRSPPGAAKKTSEPADASSHKPRWPPVPKMVVSILSCGRAKSRATRATPGIHPGAGQETNSRGGRGLRPIPKSCS